MNDIADLARSKSIDSSISPKASKILSIKKCLFLGSRAWGEAKTHLNLGKCGENIVGLGVRRK